MDLKNAISHTGSVSVLKDKVGLTHEDLQEMSIADLLQCQITIHGLSPNIVSEPSTRSRYEGGELKESPGPTLVALDWRGQFTVKEMDTNPALPFLVAAYAMVELFYKP